MTLNFAQYVNATLVGLLAYCVIATNQVVTAVKPIIKAYLTNADAENRIIEVVACVAGIITVLLGIFLFDEFRSPQQAVFDCLVGIGVGLASIGNYKLLTTLVASSSTKAEAQRRPPMITLPPMAPRDPRTTRDDTGTLSDSDPGPGQTL